MAGGRTSQDDLRCGLCGQVLDGRHEQHQAESVVSAGRRVGYVVTELRGACAHFQADDAPQRARARAGVPSAPLPGPLGP